MYTKLYYEVIGSFILSLGINLSSIVSYSNNNEIISITPNLIMILASLFCALTLTRQISGGHLNPAVTLSLGLLEKYSNKKKLLYIISQLTGILSACIISFIINNGVVLQIGTDKLFYEIILIEMLATFIFVLNILSFSTETKYDYSLTSIVIVLGLFTAINISSGVSGGCINPAIAIGHNLFNYAIKHDVSILIKTLWYVIGEVLGALCAYYVYFYFYFSVNNDESSANNILPNNVNTNTNINTTDKDEEAKINSNEKTLLNK